MCFEKKKNEITFEKQLRCQKSVQKYGHLVDKGKLSEMQEKSTIIQSCIVEIESASRTTAK